MSDPVVFLLCTCPLGNVQLASQSSEMFQIVQRAEETEG